MSEPEPVKAEPAKSEPEKPKETIGSLFRSEIVKAVVGAVVVAVGGYLGGFLITPNQLFQKLFGPNPDHYLGEWHGMLGGQRVQLDVQEQIQIPESHTYKIKGVLSFAGSADKIPVEGSGDSSFIISGHVKAGMLNIELEREDTPAGGQKARYVRMLPIKGQVGARICPPTTSIADMTSISDCKPVPGSTMFNR